MVRLGWISNFSSKLKATAWGDFPELDSWVMNLYQDKMFPTREEFNRAYDTQDARLNRGTTEFFITPLDLLIFERDVAAGEFEENYTELINKIKALFECEKIVFFY